MPCERAARFQSVHGKDPSPCEFCERCVQECTNDDCCYECEVCTSRREDGDGVTVPEYKTRQRQPKV